MRDIQRIGKILARLCVLWQEAPDMRFGQFLINLGIVSDDKNVWLREDDLLLAHLEKFNWEKMEKKPCKK